MLVSPSHRLLFIHVQRTGGLTVRNALLAALPDAYEVTGLTDGRHADLSTAMRAYPELRGNWTFGFVRNPWARFYSWHAMVMRRKAAADAGNKVMARRVRRIEFWSRVSTEMQDFETFVMRGPAEFERLRTPQVGYLCADGKQADFIGRTEHLEADGHASRPSSESGSRAAQA